MTLHQDLQDARASVRDTEVVLADTTSRHAGIDPTTWVQIQALRLALRRVGDDIETLAREVGP